MRPRIDIDIIRAYYMLTLTNQRDTNNEALL